MKKINLLLAVSAALFSMSAPALALTPWSLVPITATTIAVPSNATATVQYTVTNNSVTHTLVMVPIAGISQTTTGAGICSNPFTLSTGASCTLSLQVNGSALTTNINSGPQVCQQGGDGQPSPQECYQPASQAASLNITASSTALVLGDSFGGGTVACLGGAPFMNLIAATTDNNAGIQWYNGTYTTTGAGSDNDGFTNTNEIVTSQGAVITAYAAGLCQQYAGGGYHDWFLPAKNQLNCLYTNKTVVGGFSAAVYWSSTEGGAASAWSQLFDGGFQNNVIKDDAWRVRCVRALSL